MIGPGRVYSQRASRPAGSVTFSTRTKSRYEPVEMRDREQRVAPRVPLVEGPGRQPEEHRGGDHESGALHECQIEHDAGQRAARLDASLGPRPSWLANARSGWPQTSAAPPKNTSPASTSIG